MKCGAGGQVRSSGCQIKLPVTRGVMLTSSGSAAAVLTSMCVTGAYGIAVGLSLVCVMNSLEDFVLICPIPDEMVLTMGKLMMGGSARGSSEICVPLSTPIHPNRTCVCCSSSDFAVVCCRLANKLSNVPFVATSQSDCRLLIAVHGIFSVALHMWRAPSLCNSIPPIPNGTVATRCIVLRGERQASPSLASSSCSGTMPL